MLQYQSFHDVGAMSLFQSLSNMHLSDSNLSLEPQNDSFSSQQVSSTHCPAPCNVSHTLDNCISFGFSPERDHADAVSNFITHFSPSQTTNLHCDWISVSCGSGQTTPSVDAVDAMRDAFDTLAASHRKDGNITLTVSTLDQLAQSYNVICGKWMMFCNTAEVDAFWDAIVRLICLERGKGSAKVSPNKGDNQHVICVYVDNFADWEEVMGVRDALRTIGVTYPIGFKMDAYTLLGIYRRNKWGINCNRYYQ